MKFNINNLVKVRLSAAGHARHKTNHAVLNAKTGKGWAYQAPVEDAQGWSTWQLHTLMHEFGMDCFYGNPLLPFATEIEILEEQKTDNAA